MANCKIKPKDPHILGNKQGRIEGNFLYIPSEFFLYVSEYVVERIMREQYQALAVFPKYIWIKEVSVLPEEEKNIRESRTSGIESIIRENDKSIFELDECSLSHIGESTNSVMLCGYLSHFEVYRIDSFRKLMRKSFKEDISDFEALLV